MDQPKNVIEIVVSADMCVGCGVCAGVCPAQCLSMKMEHGEHKPVLVSECLANCSLCLEVCPFYDHEKHQDNLARDNFSDRHGIQINPTVGYYLESFIGFSKINKQREMGASGGMVTWLLEQLFISGEIDKVVTVRALNNGKKPLFEMAILDNIEEVRESAGSYYYPVEISGALRHILSDKEEHRYAVVGLPCVLHGLRRAMTKQKKLRNRIKYLLGLVCGFCPAAYYTEVLSVWAGIHPSKVQTAGYRFQEGTKVGCDFQFKAKRGDGRESRPLGLLETFKYLWGRHYFAHNACNYCDDVYAEVADAVFMDAWLPELLHETRGTSIIVVRNSGLRDIFIEGERQGTCNLEACSIEDVINSQKQLIQQKKESIRKRIAIAYMDGKWLPEMREESADLVKVNESRDIRRRFRTVWASKRFWPFFRWLSPIGLPFFFLLVDTYSGGLCYGVKCFVCLLKDRLKRKVQKIALSKDYKNE